MGWGNYLAFIFAAVNTLVVTYYLAIDRAPILKNIFPEFHYYVIFMTAIGVPILVLIGYAHFKKTKAYRTEMDISVESNPYMRRLLDNSEKILLVNFELNELVVKIANNKKITDAENERINQLQKELQDYMNKKMF